MSVRRALISVSDKTGVAALRARARRLGVELSRPAARRSSSRTSGIAVTPLEELTGFARDARRPRQDAAPGLHGGILARRDDPEDLAELEAHGIEPIDLVCVNLYPFERTVGRLGRRVGGRDREDRHRRARDAPRRGEEPRARRRRSAGPERLRAGARGAPRARRDLARDAARARRPGLRSAPPPTTPAIAAGSRDGEDFPETLRPGLRERPRPRLRREPAPAGAPTTRRRARGRTCSRGSSSSTGKPLSFNNLVDLSAARLLAARVRRARLRDRQAQQPVRRRGRRRRSRRPTRRRSRATRCPPTAASSCSTGRSSAALGERARRAVRRGAVRARLRRRRARRAARRGEGRAMLARRRSGARFVTASATSGACSAGCSSRTATATRDRSTGWTSSAATRDAATWGDLLFAWTVAKHVDVERDRDRPRRPDARHRRRADEPRRRGAARGREGARARALARGRGARLRRLLPVRRRPAARARGRRHGDHPARRLEARRRGRSRPCATPARRWSSPGRRHFRH